MDFSKIRAGEVISYTDYLTVVSVNSRESSVDVTNIKGQKFTIRGKDLIEGMNSANQFAVTTKVSRTEMANILTNVGDKVFTVVFNKVNGEERILVGHLLETENQMGRSNVRDLMITKRHAIRQVDHRTLKSLIVGNTKYVIK